MTDEAGKPVAGLLVYAADPAIGPAGAMSPLATAETDGDGRFLLSPLGEEPFDVCTSATKEFPPCRALRAQGGARDLAITVRRSAPIHLRVVDVAGKAVGRVPITLWHHVRTRMRAGSASGGSFVTDDEGRVTIPALDPTLDLSLDLNPPADREDFSSLTIRSLAARLGRRRHSPGFTAILHVKDEDGRVRAAEVKRLPTELPMGWFSKQPVDPPDKTGRVVLRSLPYGTSRFSARALDGRQVWPGMSPWTAVTEKNREVDLIIPSKPRSMRIRVEDPEPGQAVHLFAESDGRDLQYVSFVVREDGVVRQSNLAVGEYSVYVMARRPAEKGGRAGLRGRFRWDGEAEVVVPTGPPATVHVRAKTPPDAEATSVTLYVNGTISVSMRKAPDGTWVAGGLPEGRYRIEVSGRRGEDFWLRGQGFAKTGEVTEIALEAG